MDRSPWCLWKYPAAANLWCSRCGRIPFNFGCRRLVGLVSWRSVYYLLCICMLFTPWPQFYSLALHAMSVVVLGWRGCGEVPRCRLSCQGSGLPEGHLGGSLMVLLQRALGCALGCAVGFRPSVFEDFPVLLCRCALWPIVLQHLPWLPLDLPTWFQLSGTRCYSILVSGGITVQTWGRWWSKMGHTMNWCSRVSNSTGTVRPINRDICLSFAVRVPRHIRESDKNLVNLTC